MFPSVRAWLRAEPRGDAPVRPRLAPSGTRRALILVSALLGAALVLERAGLVTLLAWTAPIIPRERLPWLVAIFLATCLVAARVPPARRRAALLVGSLAELVTFDLTFAVLSLAFLAGARVLIHARLATAWKIAVLLGAFAAAALSCDAWRFPGPEGAGSRLWLGYAFACQYPFRLVYYVHEARLRRFARVPLADYLLYFVYAPFFVIVPYMLAIPRFDRVARALDRNDERVVRSAPRDLALGLGWSVARTLVARLWDLDATLAAHLHAGDYALGLVLGVLRYPVQAVFDSIGPAYLVVGLLRATGVDVRPAFRAPLLAGSVLEWWRRWNTHFRDLLVDVFFFPAALALRARPALAVGVGAAAVFLLGSTALHWPKHVFGAGSFADLNVHLLVENGCWFLLVTPLLLLERRRLAARRPPRRAGWGDLGWAARIGRVAVTWMLVFGVVLGAGYGSGYLYQWGPLAESQARLEAAAARGDGAAARAELPVLARLARLRPRDPERRLRLAWALVAGRGAAGAAEARAHLAAAGWRAAASPWLPRVVIALAKGGTP